ncbi:aminotransferase class IV [Marinisporobacter balticus]|uniref:Branched-chain amino acid aminotransferase n=1 Tax=Marinisporobacter balticus TaxID=2018667 RepID=A0A4V2SA91_9FIRM|nr:aminotransferase class IV [Marinisporobacter balticus]TCO70750.1 branched-chain amino acid aminotransferase [Marinisporobacter balticus]
MKREAFLDHYIYNGQAYATEDMDIFDQVCTPIIYEVIRIIDGVPLFLEEHLDRMRKSGDLLGVKIKKSDEEITAEIFELIKINRYKDMNVKLLCSNINGEKQDFFTYFIESHYPEDQVYKKGIHTILYYSERENPNAKVMNTFLRENVNKMIQKEKAYEAILVNNGGYIMEGSRSNMFFVKDEILYTASSKDVLLGVTRKRILKVCKDLDIDVREQAIYEKEISSLDGAFMSGTSVNVLPISSINQVKLNSVCNGLIEKIAEGYKKEMEMYMNRRKFNYLQK